MLNFKPCPADDCIHIWGPSKRGIHVLLLFILLFCLSVLVYKKICATLEKFSFALYACFVWKNAITPPTTKPIWKFVKIPPATRGASFKKTPTQNAWPTHFFSNISLLLFSISMWALLCVLSGFWWFSNAVVVLKFIMQNKIFKKFKKITKKN